MTATGHWASKQPIKKNPAPTRQLFLELRKTKMETSDIQICLFLFRFFFFGLMFVKEDSYFLLLSRHPQSRFDGAFYVKIWLG